MGKIAIILGATGLTGNLLLQKLLEDNRYKEIKIFARRSLNINHPKISEYIGDLWEME